MASRAAPGQGPWQQPVRGAYPGLDLLTHAGLDQVRAFITGHAPKPPIHYLTGMRPTQAGPGQATFVMPVTDWLVCPQGIVDPTVLSILADGPLGCAFQTALPPMTPYATAELSMNYLRPIRPGGQLVATGTLIGKGRSMGFTEVRVEDGDGRLVAHGTSRCVALPPIGDPPAKPSTLDKDEEPAYDSPHPFQRPAVGSPVPDEEWARLDGRTVLELQMKGELPWPPISHLTGKRPVAVGDGTCTFVMPATEWLNPPVPRLEGGAIAMVAETAICGAVQSTTPARSIYSTVDLKVNFLRPVEADGRELRADARVVHRGRSVAVSDCDVRDSDGKIVAMARGTAMIHQGRSWRSDGE